MTGYGLVAVKRGWVPRWLWWLACGYVIPERQLATIRPFRWLLVKAVHDG